MVYSAGELTVVLANLALVMASWHALYSNKGGLEGGSVVVDRGVSGGLEGAVDGDPYEVQWQAWRRPVPACSIASELL
jgi:hypothetical protein